MPPSKIRKANRASVAQLSVSVVSSEVRNDTEYEYSVATSAHLNSNERDVIWDIFQNNMQEFYVNSVFGWDPVSKRQELFDPLSRFILVRQKPQELNNDHTPKQLVAYTMFRFDREEGEEVVYCYELQVSKNAQKRGLGKKLTQQLADIGSKWGMQKVMLTALKRNTAAIGFYKSTGFTVDPTSPEYQAGDDQGVNEDDEEYDYQILSKILSPSEA